MPAIKKISEQNIIDAACGIVRTDGMSALNARALAERLGCSTRPIYLTFGGMDEVKAEVVKRINAVYNGYLSAEVQSGKYPYYKAYGMAYIKFAREEKQYFKYTFMRDRTDEVKSEEGFEEIVSAVEKSTGLSYERARLFHLESWIFVHGIAAMLATSYITLDEELISSMLTDMFEGLKVRFSTKS